MESNKRGKLRYLIFLVFSGVMAINQIMRFVPGVNLPEVAIYRISFLVLFAVMAITGILGLLKTKFIDILFLLCAIYIFFINIINGVGIVNSLVSICWPFAFMFGEKIAGWQGNKHFEKMRLLVYFGIVISSVYAMYLNFTGAIQARTNVIGVNYIIYYGLPLLLVPYSSSSKKRSNRYAAIILLAMWLCLAIFSFKRTTLIAVVCGVMVYLYTKYFNNKRMKNKVIFFVLILLLFGVATTANIYTDGYIIDRLGDIESTGGNGRLEIWTSVIELFSKAGIVEKFFGCGGNDAVNAVIGLSAHNEFLEILYDYGIFGVLVVGLALAAMCRELLGKRTQKSKYAPLVNCSLIMIFVFSMFSHVFLYPFVSIPVFFFLGCLYSTCRQAKETQKSNAQEQ